MEEGNNTGGTRGRLCGCKNLTVRSREQEQVDGR